MKRKYLFLLICTLLFAYSCSDDNNGGYKTYQVAVQLVYPEGGLNVAEGIAVKLSDANQQAYDATTDQTGKAVFTVPAGIYEASASDTRSSEGYQFIYNGRKSNIAVTDAWVETDIVNLELTESKSGQVVIKELYVGGCQKDDGSGVFQYDNYIILYNNSSQTANLDNLCLGTVIPSNAHGSSGNYDYVGGKLFFEAEGWLPAGWGLWYFPSTLTIEPGKQVVIALNNAIDNTQTYSKSINFANPEYYCTYDIGVYNHAGTYPAPSELIPTSHYWKAIAWGNGTAWVYSKISPAMFIFTTKGTTPVDFGNDADNMNYYNNNVNGANARKKVPVDWILDGVEVFTTTATTNQKRLSSVIDAGQTYLENKIGYSTYRNVDKDATEAIEENAGKLVYNYNKGTTVNGKESTDPSGIDAEASLKNGARIVYKDTNNSEADFHQRAQASLRD
jgi:hypothetical protein